MKGRGALAAALWLGSLRLLAAGETAVYRLSGADAALFDQYDNDGYSLALARETEGTCLATVRTEDRPLVSHAAATPAGPRDPALAPAPDRDWLVDDLARGWATQAEVVVAVLRWIASSVRYDPDRLRLQSPAAVFASRRAFCVGYSELAVDLLRRAGIRARTVQGVLAAEANAREYDPKIGGVYHRWIEIFYPDRGWVFSDPASSVNGVDARYLPFHARSLSRPRDLKVDRVSSSGKLHYETTSAGAAVLRLRPTGGGR